MYELEIEGYEYDSLEDARDDGFYLDEDKYRMHKNCTEVTLDLYEQMRYLGMI